MIKRVLVTILSFCFLLLFSACVFAEEPPLPSPPPAPSEVEVSAIKETSAIVTWSASPTANHYSVFVNGKRFAGNNTLSVTLRNLDPYTYYTVYVTAINDAGESGPSYSVQFRTLPPVPGIPQGLKVNEVQANSVFVSWHSLPEWQYISKYRLYLDGSAIADVDPVEGIQQAQLTNVPEGDHTVAVSAINDNREGELSEPVSFTVFPALPGPAGLTVANKGPYSVCVSWDGVSGAEGYKIYLDSKLLTSTTNTYYCVQNLQPEQQYQISVSAVMNNGQESLKSSINVTTLPVPAGVEIYDFTRLANSYLPAGMAGLIAVFAVGGAVKLADIGKYSVVRRIFRRM